MSRWDVERAKARGSRERLLPRCSRCGLVRVLDPCRDCATPNQLANYPPLPAPNTARVLVPERE